MSSTTIGASGLFGFRLAKDLPHANLATANEILDEAIKQVSAPKNCTPEAIHEAKKTAIQLNERVKPLLEEAKYSSFYWIRNLRQITTLANTLKDSVAHTSLMESQNDYLESLTTTAALVGSNKTSKLALDVQTQEELVKSLTIERDVLKKSAGDLKKNLEKLASECDELREKYNTIRTAEVENRFLQERLKDFEGIKERADSSERKIRECIDVFKQYDRDMIVLNAKLHDGSIAAEQFHSENQALKKKYDEKHQELTKICKDYEALSRLVSGVSLKDVLAGKGSLYGRVSKICGFVVPFISGVALTCLYSNYAGKFC